MPIRILQISDMHLFADPSQALLGVNTHESFKAVCNKVQQDEKQTQLILLTGDIAQDHSEGAYLRVADMLSPLQLPTYYIPGNHDDTNLMPRLFPREYIRNDKHIIVGNWQIILLNSQKPGAVEGLLDESQLLFAKQSLEIHFDKHALIVLHHHPIPVGSRWLDNLMLSNADAFWQLLAQYPNANTVLCGHVHQEFASQFKNINFYSVSSTCFQFKRKQDAFGIEKLPPGYRWLDLYPDGSLQTGINRVAEYVGVFDESAQGY